MSKSKSGGSIFFKTGDGKTIKVDNDICKISEYLKEVFDQKTSHYFENTTERCIELLIEFYNEYLGLSAKQLGMMGDPKLYIGVKKPDEELVRIYNGYKKLNNRDLFGLLKTAHDMKVKTLSGMLTHIVAQMIAGKSIDALEAKFIKDDDIRN
jgi:hypothetical protein